jgi:hypothetical protein
MISENKTELFYGNNYSDFFCCFFDKKTVFLKIVYLQSNRIYKTAKTP